MNTDLGNANGGVPTVPESAVANNPVVSPLDNLKDVVTVVQQGAQTAPPLQTSAETSEVQFKNQFGSGPATPPVAGPPLTQNIELNPAGVGLADASSGQPSTDNLVVQQDPQTLEAAPKPEETSLDPKQKFIDGVLELTKEYEASEENKAASS